MKTKNVWLLTRQCSADGFYANSSIISHRDVAVIDECLLGKATDIAAAHHTQEYKQPLAAPAWIRQTDDSWVLEHSPYIRYWLTPIIFWY